MEIQMMQLKALSCTNLPKYTRKHAHDEGSPEMGPVENDFGLTIESLANQAG
jgi:hypothetical protein